ncbi:MAG: cupredoxin domain-containing protein [Candidatus Micrarchaeota archaeon]
MDNKAMVGVGFVVGLVLVALLYGSGVQYANAGSEGAQANDSGGLAAACGINVQTCAANAGGAVAEPAGSSNQETENWQPETETLNMSFNWEQGVYEPREIRVRAGDTVRIVADTETFVGCMSTIVINGMGVSKRIVPGDNVLEFVAERPGRYRITCGMGMGDGLLLVEDGEGNVPAEVAAPVRTGCGCGGGGSRGTCGG